MSKLPAITFTRAGAETRTRLRPHEPMKTDDRLHPKSCPPASARAHRLARGRRAACGGVLGMVMLCSPVTADTATWTGPDAGGTFHTAGNWSTAAVPGAASEVIIDGETATPRTVTQNGTA